MLSAWRTTSRRKLLEPKSRLIVWMMKYTEAQYNFFHVNSGSTESILVTWRTQGHQYPSSVRRPCTRSRELVHLAVSKARPFTHTSEQIKVAGSAKVKAQHNSHAAALTPMVMEGTGLSLLGQDWLAALKLNRQERSRKSQQQDHCGDHCKVS